jgi:hypothetical protein
MENAKPQDLLLQRGHIAAATSVKPRQFPVNFDLKAGASLLPGITLPIPAGG